MKSTDQNLSMTLETRISMGYRTYLPENYSENGDPMPLLCFMHGSGERGNNLDYLERYTLPSFLKEGLELPFVVVCPQCEHMWNAQALDRVLDKAIEQYHVDLSRVYLTGNSLGGLGTWMLANVASHKLAAIVPICGPAVRINPENFKDLPTWVIHGAMDSEVAIGESVKMVRVLRNAGCDVRFTVHADLDHDTWTPTYHDPEFVTWLLSHQRTQ